MFIKSCSTANLINSSQVPSLLAMKYHEQALFHNEVLFWICLIAGSIILGLAIGLVLYALLTPGVYFGLAAVDVAAGLLLKLVSALFYKEMNASRERTMALYDRIQRDERLDRSAALVSDIPDARIKSATIAKLALQIASNNESLPSNSNQPKRYNGHT
jgi:hypothetical protein